MAGTVKGIPDGASVIIPRLFCRDVVAAIGFCTSTFGAVERVRRPGQDGMAVHALLTIGPAMIMLEAEWPGGAGRAPQPDGSSPVAIYVYVVGRPHRMDHGSLGARLDHRYTHGRDHRTREAGPFVAHSDASAHHRARISLNRCRFNRRWEGCES